MQPKSSIEIKGQWMGLMAYGMTKEEADNFAKNHEQFRKEHHFRDGTAIIKTSKNHYAFYSALMAP